MRCLFTLLCLSSFYVAAVNAPGANLKSPQGFNLTYPDKWQVADQATVEHFAQMLPGMAAIIRAAARDNFADHMYVLIKPLPAGFDKLDAEGKIKAIEEMSDDPKAKPHNATDVKIQQQEVAGKTAVTVSYENAVPRPSVVLRSCQVYVPGKEKVYVVYFTGLKKHWDTTWPIARDMIKSIQIDVANPPQDKP